MGAWGAGAFENDDASDWVWELEDDTNGEVLAEALSQVNDLAADEYLEAPEACNALAAAEIIASARGPRSPGLPGEAAAWLDAHPTVVDDAMILRAATAVERIGTDSELKELWEEAENTEWAELVAALLARLR